MMIKNENFGESNDQERTHTEDSKDIRERPTLQRCKIDCSV